MIKNTSYDLVFMDHMMPEMDGVEAAEIIRGMGVDIPIIALTANVVAGTKGEFLAAGMNDMLAKPIDRALFNKALETWLPAEKIGQVSGEALLSEPQSELKSELAYSGASSFWEKLEGIPGLSVQTGLDRVSGRRDVYERSLKLALKEIEKCGKNLSAFLTAADMRNFKIEVHGIKGSLANIGAMELSALAFELETASAQGDLSLCAAKLPDFLERLASLRQSISDTYREQNQDDKYRPAILPEMPAIFEKLSSAINASDFAAINTGIDGLYALNPQEALRTEIDKIKRAAQTMNYPEALELMSGLMRF